MFSCSLFYVQLGVTCWYEASAESTRSNVKRINHGKRHGILTWKLESQKKNKSQEGTNEAGNRETNLDQGMKDEHIFEDIFAYQHSGLKPLLWDLGQRGILSLCLKIEAKKI